MIRVIEPDWPAPARVRALSTTRAGGFGTGPYASLNLGDRVGDDPRRVRANRDLLRRELGLPGEPVWLQQVHGCGVVAVETAAPGSRADAAVAVAPARVCAVLTADCLPLLLCDRQGTRVAAVHAGWRGLVAGVVEAALDAIAKPPAHLLGWMGPAIGPAAFEVGAEVRARFIAARPEAAAAFTPTPGGRWLADIYQLARQRLRERGIGFIGGGEYCTVSAPERFFSYRRDGVTGRMASLIWIASASGNGNKIRIP